MAQRGHVADLQSLRGIAAVVVVLAHTLLYAAGPPSWVNVVAILLNAHAAVVLFYVMSGFVLARSLESRLTADAVIDFYTRRLFRIYPLLLTATAAGVAYLLFAHFRFPVTGASTWFTATYRADRAGWPWFALAALGMPYVLPPAWSILVELAGSTLLPLLVWARSARRRLFYGLGLLLLALSFAVGHSPASVAVYLVDFAIGSWLASPPAGLRRALSLMDAGEAKRDFIMLLLTLVLLRSVFPGDYHAPGLQLIEAALAAGLIALVVYSPLAIAVLKQRFAIWIGDVSYSIYLLHWVVMCIVAKGLDALVPADRHPAEFTVLLAGLTLATTLPLAWLTYRLIEKPGIAAGKRALRQLHRLQPDPRLRLPVLPAVVAARRGRIAAMTLPRPWGVRSPRQHPQ